MGNDLGFLLGVFCIFFVFDSALAFWFGATLFVAAGIGLFSGALMTFGAYEVVARRARRPQHDAPPISGEKQEDA
jgi:hypothetical protein